MDTTRTGTLDNAAAAIELAWQAAASNIQLLSMLDVVQEWGRADAASVSESVEQTERLVAFAGQLQLGTEQPDIDRIRKTLESVAQRAERLAQLASGQARDSGSGTAMAKALRQLAAASDALRGSFVGSESDTPAT